MSLPTGFKFLKPSALRHWERFPSYTEIRDKSPEAWFNAERPLALPLFVSHRWLATDAPDPEGEQLRALQELLRMIGQVAHAVREKPGERTRRIPTPYVHGLLQAFSIIGAAHGNLEDKYSEWQTWAQCWQRMHGRPPKEMSEAVVEEIGIWYDYSCMPTSSASSSDARHSDEVREALYRMSDLVAACPVLVLRSQGDDYTVRGWCAAEVSVGREAHKHIVLRTDLIGRPIRRRSMIADADPFKNALGTGRLLQILDIWSSEDAPLSKGQLYMIHYDYGELSLRESARSTPCFTTPPRPEIFPGHRKLLVTMIERLGELTRDDSRRGRLQDVDLGGIISKAMAEAGLRCSVDDDVVFVGCAILQARNIGAPQLADFYHEAQRRWVVYPSAADNSIGPKTR